MTKQRDLKARVRARMEKTGESYARAKQAVLQTGSRETLLAVDATNATPEQMAKLMAEAHRLDPAIEMVEVVTGVPDTACSCAWTEGEHDQYCLFHEPASVPGGLTKEEYREIRDAREAYAESLSDEDRLSGNFDWIRSTKRWGVRCDTPYDQCMLPKGHRSPEHGDDHQKADGTWWNMGQTIPKVEAPKATDMMKKAIEAWGITIAPDGKLTAADGRVLKARWSPESAADIAMDLKALHGIDGEVEMARAVLDAVFTSLMLEVDTPLDEKPKTEVVSEKYNVKINPFERELMRTAAELKPDEREQKHLNEKLAGPDPTALPFSEESHKRYLEVLGKPDGADLSVKPEDGCTCGEAIGGDPYCTFHHRPVIEVTPDAAMGKPFAVTMAESEAKRNYGVDVAQKLVEKAIAEHAAKMGDRTVVRVDVGDMTPEDALKVVTASKAALKLETADRRCPPIIDGRCLRCERSEYACECEADEPGTTYARCPNKKCAEVYRIWPGKSRLCEYCGHPGVEVIDPRAKLFETPGGFLTARAEDVGPCPVRSSVSGQPCLLRKGHEAHDSNRFHYYQPAEPQIFPVAPGEFENEFKKWVGVDRPQGVTMAEAIKATASMTPEEVADGVKAAVPDALKINVVTDSQGRPVIAQVLLPMVVTPVGEPPPDLAEVKVNGASLWIGWDPVSYNDVLRLAKKERERNLVQEITYCSKAGLTGNLWPGGATVIVEDGLEFFVTDEPAAGGVKVIVNGAEKVVEREVSYHAAVLALGLDPDRNLTVTYRWTDAVGAAERSMHSGSLYKGGPTVRARHGMVFNVADTSRA